MLVGSHINTTKGFVSSITHAKNTGCEIFQIFLGSPRSIRNARKKLKDLEAINQKSKEFNIKILIHASYTLNFCHPPESETHKILIQTLINNLRDADILESIGVVVHMGKNTKELKQTEEESLNNYVLGIKKVIEETSDLKQKILFETGASQGTEICSKIPELAKLYNRFTDEEKERIGFCVDTCHIFATGYDISTTIGVNKFYHEFNKEIGWKNVIVVHFNDSLGKCNSHLDRHGDIGRGEIGLKGLKLFAKLCWKTDIPMVLETKCFYYRKKNVINFEEKTTEEYEIETDKKKWDNCHRFTHEEQINIMKKGRDKWNSN